MVPEGFKPGATFVGLLPHRLSLAYGWLGRGLSGRPLCLLGQSCKDGLESGGDAATHEYREEWPQRAAHADALTDAAAGLSRRDLTVKVKSGGGGRRGHEV